MRPGSTVTFAMLQGDKITGRLPVFVPGAADHRVETTERAADGSTRTVPRMVPAEKVAWIGVHRDPNAAPRPTSASLQTFHVHVGGGVRHTVRVDPASLTHPLGFFGQAVDDMAPYGEFWFYHHGVNAREQAEPIGAIMMRRGVISPEPLARGLQSQALQRATPLGQILVEQRRVSSEGVAEAMEIQKRKRMRIGEVLIEAGLATAEDVQVALGEQKRRQGKKLGQVLVEMEVITEADLAIALAEKFGVPFVDLDQSTIDPAAVKAVPRDVLEKHAMLPLAIDDRSVTLALADPLNTDAIDFVRLHLKRRVHEVLATPTQLNRFVAAALGNIEKGDSEFKRILAQLAEETHASAVVGSEATEGDAQDSAVIKLVNQVIADACRRNASDIHVEPGPEKHGVLVRFRIDGDCIVYQELPETVRQSLTARIKVMANLDISERRKPQDGKIRFRFHDKLVELRVATIPTVNGNEDVVMRILASSKPLPMERLGLSERNLREVRKALAQPHGLGQDDDAARHAGLHQHPRHEDLDRRGPGGDHAARAPAAPGAPAHRAHLRGGAAVVPARRPRRDHGGRDARSRDRGHRRRGVADGAPGVLDAAHEQRAGDDLAPHRHGRRALHLRRRALRRARAAARSRALREVRGALSPRRCGDRRVRALVRRSEPEDRAAAHGPDGDPGTGPGLRRVRRLGLQGPRGPP